MPNGLRRTSPLLAVVNASGLVISITTRPCPPPRWRPAPDTFDPPRGGFLRDPLGKHNQLRNLNP